LAQLNLADCYAEGLGVPKDIVQAIGWYLRVADRPGEATHWGDSWYSETEWIDDHYAVDAWRKLGAIYLSGLDVTKDEAEAYAYYSLVGLNGEADRKAIAELEAKLKPAELEAGKRRAKELREKLNAKRQQAGKGK
jgi:TPR repeat protein